MFSDISASMGILSYPPKFDEIYTSLSPDAKPLFHRSYIDDLQEKYNLFGTYYDAVIRGWEDLEQKENEMIWTKVASLYVLNGTQQEAKDFELPAEDGSPSRDMIPLFLLIPRVELAIRRYQERGFSEKESIELMHVIRSDLSANEKRFGRPLMNRTYYNWITLYVYNLLFPMDGFRFNFSHCGKFTYVLKHKKENRLAVLLHDRTIHHSGYILGAAGKKDEEGSYPVTVEETETHWIGHAAGKDCLIHPEKEFFPKSEWELVVSPGDDVLSIHIPRGTDLSPESVSRAIEDAFRFARKFYPEYSPKAVYCASWLLSPELTEFLGENSHITTFGALFSRYPSRTDGTSVFNFVFSVPSNTELTKLPENTRLQHALKEKYLAGGYLLNFSGFILPPN